MGEQAIPFVTKSWIVPPGHKELRLDAFARHCLPHLSRRAMAKAIGAKSFSVRGKPGMKGDRLASGDKLVFHGPASWLAVYPVPESMLEVPVVYEDAAVLIVSKPAGMPTHGFSGRESGTLANCLLAGWPSLLNIGTSRWQPGLVHRLDRETSGLVLVAKTAAAFANLKSQFRRRQVKKTYWALVWGRVRHEGVISTPLAHDRQDRTRMRAVTRPMRVKEKTWPAITRYRTVGRSRGLSLLEVDMATGVTHQIRVHLASIGHPIVGDNLYGADGAEDLGLQRHFLHAGGLTIRHPVGGQLLTARAELPGELDKLLRRLKIKV